jgi:lipopolysaccharide export system permease protein
MALLSKPTPEYLGELTWRLGLILAATNMVLLAIGLATMNPRRASNWNLMFALLTFFVYYNLISLSLAWVSNGKMGMGAVLLLTHGTALLLALYLMWRQDTMRRRPRRVAAAAIRWAGLR